MESPARPTRNVRRLCDAIASLPTRSGATVHGSRPWLPGIVLVCCCCLCVPAFAATALVAVAASFAPAARQLGQTWEQQSGHSLKFSIGSTGKLYSQIVNGAPYDLFLAADEQWTERLIQAGLAVEDSRTTCAIGTLVLWSPDARRLTSHGPDVLRRGEFRRLAIANPKLAPYGRAARETLRALGLWTALQARIVQAENVAQASAMAASGNAELAFIAGSVQAPGGSHWIVPARLHRPIRQQAVLLNRAAGNVAARGFLAYLRSDEAKARLVELGYRMAD
ncbi:MAG TPA: molybdate ABC transporter substrate-binding protein [Chromatiales bacterium]|nr:molybdate ABC transporter substrate-binding protein [Chromatiales bacterium]